MRNRAVVIDLDSGMTAINGRFNRWSGLRPIPAARPSTSARVHAAPPDVLVPPAEAGPPGKREITSRDQPYSFGPLVGASPITTAQLNTATVTQVKLPYIVPLDWEWELRLVNLLVTGQAKVSDPTGSIQTGQTPSGFTSVTASAAAAGTLTASGMAYLSGFSVDPAAAWPAGTNQVTVTNLNGGTQTYDLPGGTTNSLRINYPAPIPAPYNAPVISVPAIVSGPAYSINAFGVVLGSGFIDSVGSIFGGNLPAPLATGPGVLGETRTTTDADVIEPVCPLPFKQRYGPGDVVLTQGQTLYAEVWNAVGAGSVMLSARFRAVPVGIYRGVTVI